MMYGIEIAAVMFFTSCLWTALFDLNSPESILKNVWAAIRAPKRPR